MIIRKMLLLTLFSSLLTSCGLMGDYIPPDEIAPVSRAKGDFVSRLKNLVIITLITSRSEIVMRLRGLDSTSCTLR
ncbi:hypothetical protein ERHA55_33320 [Erwinia rhapontici]|nr:hypothetical protein ERHA55_33320 [Erwinia rhapontici]